MSSDGYMFFTETHRLYVQGVRCAIRERLIDAFGEDWWERGVERALQGNLLKSLREVVEKNPDYDRHLFIATSHFGRVIVKHHNDVFRDAFSDTVQAFNDFCRLNELRNEWAHMYDISLSRAVRAADLMKSILASLRREEALEIERMSNDLSLEPGDRDSEGSLDYSDHQDDGLNSQSSAPAPLEFWRQLQSYLVLERSVELPDDLEKGEARVILTAHNTAPDGADWPAVHFRSIDISASGGSGRTGILNDLAPGDTRSTEFRFPVKQLVDVKFQVHCAIDPNVLGQFQRSISLPEPEVVPCGKSSWSGWNRLPSGSSSTAY